MDDKVRNIVIKGTSKLIIIAAIFIIIAALIAAKKVVLPTILAIFISIICLQPIEWLNKKGVNYNLAVFGVLVFTILIFSSLGGVIGNSFSEFMSDLPMYQTKLDTKLATTLGKLERFDESINTKQLLTLIEPDKVIDFTTGALTEVGKFLSDFFIILLITIFILLEANSFNVKGRVIEKYSKGSKDSFTKISTEIRNYLSIKTLISFCTGIFIWIWLLTVGVDYALMWGVFAFLLNYIPNIGSIIAAVPTMLLALVQLGWGGFVWTGVGYLIVNAVMGSFVEPKVMGRGLGLSTLVVFLSLIFWGFIFGPVGMFLSVPLTITLKIMCEQKESTRWVAIMLGTEQDARKALGEEPTPAWNNNIDMKSMLGIKKNEKSSE